MNPPPRQPSYGPGRPPPPGQYGRPPSSMPAPARSSTMNSMGRPLPPNPQRQGSQYGAPMPPQHRSSMHHPMPQRPPPPQATSSSSSSSSHYAPIGTDQRRQSREYLYQTRASRPPPPPQGMYQRPPPPQHHPSQRNGPPPPAPPPGTAYRRANTVSRSKSLSRPERQRPRQGMFRTPSQQRRMIGSGQLGPIGNTMMHHYQRPPPRMNSPNQPMSNRLQQQLHQQKLQQQQEALNYAAAAPNANHRQLAGPAVKGKYNPQPATPAKVPEIKPKVLTNWWSWMAFMFTCCCPNWCLRVCLRKRNPWVQQAWREKVTLCVLILLLCAALGYVTYGLTRTLCPTQQTNLAYSQELNGKRSPVWRSDVRVYGSVYDFGDMVNFMGSQGLNFTKDYENLDISSIFDDDTTGACTSFDSGATSTLGNCVLNSPYGGSLKTSDGKCISTSKLNGLSSKGYLAFDWEDLRPKGTDSLGDTNLVLVGDSVLNLTRYVNTDIQFFGAQVDKVLQAGRGNDISYSLLASSAGANARQCLVDRYSIGIMEVDTAGCIASQIIMTTMLVVIVAMIIIRYSMALMFQWIIASRLVKPGGRSNWLAWRSIKGGNDDPANHVPGPYNNYAQLDHLRASSSSIASSRATPTSEAGLSTAAILPNNIVSTELYTAMMVTCYSEGEEGIRTTMDSLALTTYNKKRKAFFVICDGMITGAGESRSTPDIVVSMMDLDPTMRDPKPSSYLAIADGEKQLNMAKVYAGHYKNVPCITIVKCGTEEEGNGPKAGNRGKRDSQLILMSFFQRVLFNDRFSELDYEIFWKLTWLMKGTTPDKFELVLMVDADTKVLPDAITYMVAAMANDITIMGLCGETRIANKSSSWVTAIQVFEYYISHHYAKAFESLFGIVTCLPGCFCMYRIKAPKNGAWVPILANPDIILEYNQNVVATLHEKNLLLLGEDRFLSTLMLRTFPKRQMMFVPQARCKTVVPDEFRVLLSQRRRWINSTVHNLMELVLVSDLCGIACLSMQFSIFVDLLGTLVLPAAICMTVYLIINTAISANPNWQSLALLIAILGLPAVLIAITSFNYVYIMWMFIYIISLPIWNLVLPVYSFWHFDDFSWGATRVVAGEKKDKGHGDGDGKFDSSRLVMKKWEDWEAERTGQRVNKNRMSLRTPGDPPLVFDGYNPAQRKSGVITPTTPGAFGGMFNDRKMYGSPSNQP